MSTPEQERKRIYALRARLKKSAEDLKAFEVRLLVLHADETGIARMSYPGVPLIPSEYFFIARNIALRERAAATGCELSAAWLQDTAPRRARIDELRNTPLKERAPDYSGPWLLATWPSKAARRLDRAFLRSSEDARALAAEYIAREEARRAVWRAQTAEYVARLATREKERRAR